MAATCLTCGAEQAHDARFCSACGAPQYRPCPTCGEAQPVGAAFCTNCGGSLAGGSPPDRAPEQQERRIVTVLFADLAGSTALGEQLDPEDIRDVQGELFALLNAEVERYGGMTEKFVGDAILAVFGIPLAHEDDPERAVRAALGAQSAFVRFAETVERRYGASVGLRIGINTGDVVSGREAAARGELMVSGDAVNVAARLQQAAAPGEILVGPRTHSATSRTVTYGERRQLEAKGKSAPVPSWAVLTLEAEPAVRASGFRARLVGREEELTVLEAVAARVRREQVPQLVTLFGPAGVGKSRLVDELLARVPAARVLQGRCLPYGEGITYWPLAEAAKSDAEILDTDHAEVALEKLRAAVERAAPDGAEDVLDAVAWTIGLTVPDSRLASADAQAIGERLADGWQRYVGSLGRLTLTVLVIEDVHWASAALLDLVEQLLDMLTETCVLVVCTARPEFLDDRPTWGAGRQNTTALSLTPLSSDESAQLVSGLLGDASVPDDVRRPILESAEGNPFFLEEMLQMLIDEGALERRNGSWTATGRLAEIRVPDSVHGVIAARLDLLEPDAREALRRCAVVGRVFWPAAVGVDEQLVSSLARTGLVSPSPQSVMGGLREFTFKHALTRDVAYGTLPRPERRDLHRRVAEWIQTVAPDREVEMAELVGYHYLEAISYGEDDPSVAGRAYEVLLAAGRAATRRAALGAATRHFEHALELAKADVEKAAALLGLIEIEPTDQAWVHLDEAERLQGIDAPLRSEILAWRSRVSWLTGRWAEALSAADQAVSALEGLSETPQLARALARRSQIEMLRNQPVAREHSRDALELAERVGDDFSVLNARINLMTVEANQFGIPPDPAEALDISLRSAALGLHEEASRVMVNFIWSGSGYLAVHRIEEVVEASREQIYVPQRLADYLDLSVGMMLLSPSGRWVELETIVGAIASKPLNDPALLVFRPLTGLLALRRGDLRAADTALDGLLRFALVSGEAQRTVPSACAVFPWLHLHERNEELREAAGALIRSVEDEWPIVFGCHGIVRSLAASEEWQALGDTLASMRRARSHHLGRLAVTLAAGEALLHLAAEEPEPAIELLRGAIATDDELGFAYDAACLRLDLARALDAAGAEDEAAIVRGDANRVLEPLRCVNPF